MANNYLVDWRSKTQRMPSEIPDVRSSDFLFHWDTLRDHVIADHPTDKPVLNYLTFLDSKFRSYIAGDFPQDETLMSLANQVEDVIYALELRSIGNDKKSKR